MPNLQTPIVSKNQKKQIKLSILKSEKERPKKPSNNYKVDTPIANALFASI